MRGRSQHLRQPRPFIPARSAAFSPRLPDVSASPARSILSLIGLTGAGVAVGSGVAMMSMQLAAQEAAGIAPAPAVAHSARERRTAARGFAASQQQ